MKYIHLYISLVLGVLLFLSCETEIPFNGETTAPQVVVNSYLTPDSVVSAHISLSRFFLANTADFVNVVNANVSVYVNGNFKETMSHLNNGSYRGTYKPGIGETIKFLVKVPSKKEVTCETKIESSPVVVSIENNTLLSDEQFLTSSSNSFINGVYTPGPIDTIGTVKSRTNNFSLKFKDNGAERNYYRLVVITKNFYLPSDNPIKDIKNDSLSISYYFQFTDIVSGNNKDANNDFSFSGSSTNPYNLFSDDLFNGNEYTLKFTSNNSIYNYYPKANQRSTLKSEVSVYLQSVSRSYYLYLKSRQAAYENDGNFFSEAVQIHNNVVGGYGIMGTYTSNRVLMLELK